MQVREMFDLDHYEKPKKKRNVCAYARVSTTKDLQYTSYEYQVKTYTEMITTNDDWNFIGVYADEGKSGTNIMYRDNFQLMIQLALSGFIDMIITKSISRFARNVVDCLTIVKELKESNVEVYFETDNISSFDPKIDFVISLLASMAEEESRNTSENVKWNVRSRFAEGKFYAVSKRILGYDNNGDDGSLIINKKESTIVKRIFDAYTNGISVAEICDQLNYEGLLTKFSNKKWDSTAVLGILKNEKYTGNALLQKTLRPDFRNKNLISKIHDLPMYYVENSHPAIIPLEQFKKAEKIRLKRIERFHACSNETELKEKFNVHSEYAGKITCGVCGKTYRFKRNNIGTAYEKRILKCASNKGKKTCLNKDLFCDTFDEVLVNQIRLILENKNQFITGLESAFSNHTLVIEAKNNLDATQAQIKALERKADAFKTLNDEFDLRVLEELTDQIKKLKKSSIEIENRLITTYNIKNRIKIIKKLISTLPTEVKAINEFDYDLLFQNIIIKENNTIDFVINFAEKASRKRQVILPGTVDYLIRKTTHTIKHRIVIV